MGDYITIGRQREDGDIDVLATLNNDNIGISQEQFGIICALLWQAIELESGQECVCLQRQDAPDVVSAEEGED